MPILCPNCETQKMHFFYESPKATLNNTQGLINKEQALNHPKASIRLYFCPVCHYISNHSFSETLINKEHTPLKTTLFSHTFQTFQKRLALDLVKKHSLFEKTILNIGYKNEEFLSLLCKAGKNQGISWEIPPENRSTNNIPPSLFPDIKADFICCKMTLEHIHKLAPFIRSIQKTAKNNDTLFFFQVPNATKIIKELNFWDIYYEHCSYFTNKSLISLLQKYNIHTLDLYYDYSGQSMMLEGKMEKTIPSPNHSKSKEIPFWIYEFSEKIKQKINIWEKILKELKNQSRQTVLWGSGSKAVSFLNTLQINEEIEYVVDINPNKKNRYIPGTGQKIVDPDFLKQRKPEIVFVANPIYQHEVQSHLKSMNLFPIVTPIDQL